MIDIEDIRRDINKSFQDARLRHGVLLQLLESVVVANDIAPQAWSVSRFSNGFRLNIGHLEALVALDGELRVNLLGSLGVPPFTGPHFKPTTYKSARLPVIAYVGPVEVYMELKETLADAHEQFIRMASTTKDAVAVAGTRYRSSHDPALIRYAYQSVTVAYTDLPAAWRTKLSELMSRENLANAEVAQEDLLVYHSERTMGRRYERAGEDLSFFSTKSEARLRPSLGQRVWAIASVGEGKPRFFLVGVYTPVILEEREDVRYLRGKGLHLNPYVDVTGFEWFQNLYSAQNNFSYGNFNRIRSRDAVLGLEAALKSAQSMSYPDDLPARHYTEGTATRVLVNRYERDPRAREDCLKHFGTACYVCGLDLSARYGEVAKGLIHVHHLVPLSSIESNYEVDPHLDLIPICPNCHAVAHRTDPPMTPDEIRSKIKNATR